MLGSLWGAHVMFVYLWKPKPHVEGVQDLEGAEQQTHREGPSFSAERSTFLAQGDASLVRGFMTTSGETAVILWQFQAMENLHLVLNASSHGGCFLSQLQM